MSTPIRRRQHAQEQLEQHVDRLAEDSVQAAIRLIDAMESCAKLLADWPEVGGVYETENAALDGIRKWVLPEFRRYIVFYLYAGEVVDILDVVDGRSDFVVKDYG